MTTLRELATLTGGDVAAQWADVHVDSASLSSQDVAETGLFCGVPGTRAHGASYAAGSGAAAVLTDAAGFDLVQEANPELPVLVVDDVRRWMGPVAAEIYGHPAEKLTIIGLTGTSGKTTTSYLVEAALLKAGLTAGLIGTTGTRIAGQPIPTSLTTPEAPTLQALLARMVAEGVTHLVMEVSSHALALGRVSGVDFDVVAFTNLSQDHLDFHPTMEDYFETKAALFGPGPAHAVVCCDDDWGQRMAAIATQHIPNVTVTSAAADAAAAPAPEAQAQQRWQLRGADVRSDGTQVLDVAITSTAEGQEVTRDLHYSISMGGVFNQSNSLVALACLAVAGVDPEVAARSLIDVHVPGRMQLVAEGQPFLAMVDYAHKPGALEAVLRSIRDYVPSADARIGVVFGAGGNRDTAKRPVMGRIAGELAQAIFLADDNSRDEDPATIRAAIAEGVEEGIAKQISQHPASQGTIIFENIGARAAAIRAAVDWAGPGDAIVVAGKGHETGQDFGGGRVEEFDDVAQLRGALQDKLSEVR